MYVTQCGLGWQMVRILFCFQQNSIGKQLEKVRSFILGRYYLQESYTNWIFWGIDIMIIYSIDIYICNIQIVKHRERKVKAI